MECDYLSQSSLNLSFVLLSLSSSIKQPVNVSISNANWPLDGTLETAVCSSQKVVCVWEHKPPIKNGLTQHLVDYMDTTSMTASLSATDSTHAETYDHVYTFQIEIQSMLSVYIGP